MSNSLAGPSNPNSTLVSYCYCLWEAMRKVNTSLAKEVEGKIGAVWEKLKNLQELDTKAAEHLQIGIGESLVKHLSPDQIKDFLQPFVTRGLPLPIIGNVYATAEKGTPPSSTLSMVPPDYQPFLSADHGQLFVIPGFPHLQNVQQHFPPLEITQSSSSICPPISVSWTPERSRPLETIPSLQNAPPLETDELVPVSQIVSLLSKSASKGKALIKEHLALLEDQEADKALISICTALCQSSCFADRTILGELLIELVEFAKSEATQERINLLIFDLADQEELSNLSPLGSPSLTPPQQHLFPSRDRRAPVYPTHLSSNSPATGLPQEPAFPLATIIRLLKEKPAQGKELIKKHLPLLSIKEADNFLLLICKALVTQSVPIETANTGDLILTLSEFTQDSAIQQQIVALICELGNQEPFSQPLTLDLTDPKKIYQRAATLFQETKNVTQLLQMVTLSNLSSQDKNQTLFALVSHIASQFIVDPLQNSDPREAIKEIKFFIEGSIEQRAIDSYLDEIAKIAPFSRSQMIDWSDDEERGPVNGA